MTIARDAKLIDIQYDEEIPCIHPLMLPPCNTLVNICNVVYTGSYPLQNGRFCGELNLEQIYAFAYLSNAYEGKHRITFGSKVYERVK